MHCTVFCVSARSTGAIIPGHPCAPTVNWAVFEYTYHGMFDDGREFTFTDYKFEDRFDDDISDDDILERGGVFL